MYNSNETEGLLLRKDVCVELAGQTNGKYSCPKIYFNHRCFSGPYLNKGRIAELPQCVGPGNCVLVMKEVSTLMHADLYVHVEVELIHHHNARGRHVSECSAIFVFTLRFEPRI